MDTKKRDFRTLLLLISFAGLIPLVSCDSTPQLTNRWVGKSKSALLATWGPPAETRKNDDGSEVYTYIKRYYPEYQALAMHPSEPGAGIYNNQDPDYPIKIAADTSKAVFWISPEGTIYKAQGRILE